MNSKTGFTLLEVLVVVMIITILATIVGVNVAREPGKARVAAAKAQILVFRTGLERYRMDHGRLPTREQTLNALCERPLVPPLPGPAYPREGYLQSRNLPADPWGNDYVYLAPGPGGEPYAIVTYGADGRPGGEDEDADISSADM